MILLILFILTITIFLINVLKVKTFFTKIKNTISLKSYSDLKNESFDYTPGGIPKIIIKTSWQKRGSFPTELEDVLLKSIIDLNPGYTLYYFDNNDCEKFMKDYSNRAYRAYKKLIPGAFKADLFRYCILEKYGGCYSDIGHILLKPLDDIIGDNNILIVNEPDSDTRHGIHNAFICCGKNEPLMIKCVDKTCENVEKKFYGKNSLDVTGPHMMGMVYNELYPGRIDGINYTHNKKILILRLIKKTLYNKQKYNIFLDTLEYNYIYDLVSNSIVIKTKFDNYHKIMYPTKKTQHYHRLWRNKKIYSRNK